MMRRTVVTLSAVVEGVTGIALIADSSLVVRLLLGAELGGGGVALGRLAGFGLLSLSVACWPANQQVGPQVTRALLTYNLLAAIYLGYLGLTARTAGLLLWPACVLHAVLALLFFPQLRDVRNSIFLL